MMSLPQKQRFILFDIHCIFITNESNSYLIVLENGTVCLKVHNTTPLNEDTDIDFFILKYSAVIKNKYINYQVVNSK